MPAMNEEAPKKNTDCVYFLASSCKKGNDCEFRHSETARLNPRDCWFWLAGTCLNSNCAFRHPPLDAPSAATATLGKTRVPCYYFGQGYCAKGEKCIFMHGLVLTTEVSVSQKLPKPNAVKVIEPNDKPSEGNSSLTSKASLLIEKTQASNPETEASNGDTEFLSAKANHTVQVPGVKVNGVLSTVPEGSDSSAPARPQSLGGTSESDKSKQVLVINYSLPQAQLADNNSVELPFEEENGAPFGEDRWCDVQPGDERVQQVDSGEDRIQNFTESEEIWEESSFDVLVDDGADQLVYVEDMEYFPVSGLIQGRLVGADDLAECEYDQSGAYNQYYDYDASIEYELATYDPYEQQADYDHMNSFDYMGRLTATAFRDRQIQEFLLQDGQEVILEREAQRDVSSNDLRNHIVNRRRAERSHKLGEDHGQRRYQDLMSNGFQHSRRHHDTHLKHHEGMTRHHILSNGHFHARREHLGNRLYHDRLESKRGRDMASDHVRISTERASNKKLRYLGEHFTSKGKEYRWLAAGATEAFGIRGYPVREDKKREAKADESLFAGPKNLAQIKTEKIKAYGSESSRQQNSSKQINHLAEHRVLPIRSQISPVAGCVIGLDCKELGKFGTRGSSRTSDFEGPKPLSVLLKEKHRGGVNGEALVKASRSEGEAATVSVMGSSTSSFSFSVNATVVKDGEPVQNNNPVLVSCSHGVNRRVTNSVEPSQDLIKLKGTRFHPDATDLSLSLSCSREANEEAQKSRVRKVNGRKSVMNGELDDDDSENFVTKLGGFFS